jgi:hypothetical protein
MPHFFAKLIAPRPSFAMEMDAVERAMMAEHFAYWKTRLDAGEATVFAARSQGAGRGRSRGARPRRCRSGDQIHSRICLRSLSDARGHARSNNKRAREASYG